MTERSSIHFPSFMWLDSGNATFWTCLEETCGRVWRICYRSAVARAVASEIQPKLYVGRCLGHNARTGSILIMTTDGVVKAARLRRLNVENRWNVDSWNALLCFPWDVTERGADTADAIQARRPQVVHLPLASHRRCVVRADLRKQGVAIGCAACSDIAVHGKTAKRQTGECRTRIGEQMEHDPVGHEHLQIHKRGQDGEREVEGNRALVIQS